MKRSDATLAIAGTRLRLEASGAAAAAGLCALVAYLQRFDDRYEHLAGALLFIAACAGASALALHSRRHRELALCEAAAPLYGRELARARALVPCAIATLGAACYWSVSALYAPPAPGDVAITLVFGYAAAMFGLCAGTARRRARFAFLAGACSVCGAGFALSVYPLAAAAVAALAIFAALRQYGETLTRSPV